MPEYARSLDRCRAVVSVNMEDAGASVIAFDLDFDINAAGSMQPNGIEIAEICKHFSGTRHSCFSSIAIDEVNDAATSISWRGNAVRGVVSQYDRVSLYLKSSDFIIILKRKFNCGQQFQALIQID